LSERRVREKSHDRKYGRRSIEGWLGQQEKGERKRRRKSPKPSLELFKDVR
jgi:hypothetical protein